MFHMGRGGCDGRHGGRHDNGGYGGGQRGGARRWGPFEVRWEMHDGPGRGGPRGRGRMFDGGELRLVLLKLIADEPRHGYDLIRAIEDLTGGAYAPSPGVVYPTLTLLDEMGLIEEQQSEGTKKRFAATAEGQTHLEENREAVEALFARLEAVGKHRERTDGAPIRRAMGNLKAVLQHKLADGDDTGDLLHQMAALIDEAAQKIERLK